MRPKDIILFKIPQVLLGLKRNYVGIVPMLWMSQVQILVFISPIIRNIDINPY